MFPCSFDEANAVLGRPLKTSDDEVSCLAVRRTFVNGDTPAIISCWKATKEELDEINRTGRVWLIVMGHTMPPATLEGTKPEPKENTHVG